MNKPILPMWQPEPVSSGRMTMDEYIGVCLNIAKNQQINALQAVDVDSLDLMKGCEQAPQYLKDEDLKPDGFPITD